MKCPMDLMVVAGGEFGYLILVTLLPAAGSEKSLLTTEERLEDLPIFAIKQILLNLIQSSQNLEVESLGVSQ
jgi:hypothetical protein